MKQMILLILMLCSFSCQTNTSTDFSAFTNSLSYFKDGRTGMCFATINSVVYGGYQVTSITCVPCDSLNRYEIQTIGK